MDKPIDGAVSENRIYEYVSNGITFNEEAPMFFASAAYVEKEKQVKLFNTAERDVKYEVAVYIKKITRIPKSVCI